MKTRILSIILILVLIYQNTLLAIDLQKNGTSHPQGIISSGSNTTVQFDENESVYGIFNGTQKGNNLFHSFDKFNLHEGESAWFIHDNSIQNIINRVDGGEHSWINGEITCGSIVDGELIPGNANFYLLNPYGIMFGGHASINFNGSFHVSTADYLTFGDGNRYYAILGEDSVLTTSEPSSFGFLDNNIAPISIEGLGEIKIPGIDDEIQEFSIEELINHFDELTNAIGGIEVAKEQTISLVGGNISMAKGNKSSFWVFLNEDNGLKSHIPFGTLTAPGGKINLISVQSKGDVNINEPDLSGFDALGNIFISENSRVDVQSGNIRIQCNDLIVDDSIINTGAYTYRTVVEKNSFEYSSFGKSGGLLNIRANNMYLHHGSIIANNTYAIHEEGGGKIDISIRKTLEFSGENDGHLNSSIFSMSNPNNYGGPDAASSAGDIDIKANNFIIKSAGIIASTEGSGDAGNINVSVEESFIISGNIYTGRGSGLESKARTKDGISGDAGSINVKANNISIFDGGGISTITHNQANAGDITIEAKNHLLLSGVNSHGTTTDGFSSGISSRSTDEGNHGENAGKAGNIDISVETLLIEKGAGIETTTFGGGDGGGINIKAEKNVRITGDSSGVSLLGFLWSQQDYRKDHPETNDYSVSGIFSSSESNQTFAGNAGEISIDAPEIIIENKAVVTTAALNAGGGSLSIRSNKLILTDSEITVSVATGDQNAGNLNVVGNACIVLNKSNIKATAYAGQGGNISIKGGNLIQSADSIIDASSQLSNDGKIFKYTPENDIAKNITHLKQSFLNASKWADTPCQYRNSDSVSQLTHKNKDGMPSPFDDLLASPPLSLDVIENIYGDHPLMFQLRKGEKLFQQGKFNNALIVWETCCSGMNKDDPFYIPLLSLMTSARHAIGKYSKAADDISKSIDILDHLDDFGKAVLLMISGETQLLYHNRKLAENYWQEAFTYAQKLNQPVLTASIRNHLGNVYVLTNRWVMASHQYETALKYLNDSQSDLKSVIMLNNTHLKFIRHDTVFQGLALKKTFQHINDLPPGYQKARCLLTLTFLISEMTDQTNALQFFSDHPMHSIMDQIKNIGKQLNHNDILSFAFGKSGALYEKQQDYDMALQQTRRAVFHASVDNHLEILYLWQWQLARIFQAMGNHQKALHSYEQAIQTLERLQYAFFMGYHRDDLAYDKKVKPVYYGYADLLLHLHDANHRVASDDCLKTAVGIIEKLKKTEIQNYFKDECITYQDEYTEIPTKMPDQTALIYPLPLKDRLVLLTLFPDGLAYYKIDIDQNNLYKWINRLLDRFDHRNYNRRRFDKYAKDLYDWLIRPIETDLVLQKIQTILFAPEGKLLSLPFCALKDRESNQYLIEKYAISLIPAISLIKQKGLQQQPYHKNALLCGLTVPRQGFSALKDVQLQLEDIQACIGGKIMMDQDFSIHSFEKEVSNHTQNIIHIATHGNVGNSPDDIFLLTYTNRLSLPILKKIMFPGVFRESPLDLLTLSACQTAAGDERTALGLAGIALKTGAQSVIGSLRPIEINATSLFMTSFYQEWKVDKFTHKAKAFQKAQRKILKHNQFAHPVFWASFILSGGWL